MEKESSAGLIVIDNVIYWILNYIIKISKGDNSHSVR
jgi:hypothetical protein